MSMRPYNIEIFRPDLTLRDHTNTSEVALEDDYLSPQDNTIELLEVAAEVGDYIYITREQFRYFGRITAVTSAEELRTTLSFRSFLSAFDAQILFDTDLQGTGTLEGALANMITDYWIQTSDTAQKITGLSVVADTSTSNWGFNLKSEKEGAHHICTDFYETFVRRSMEKYRVGIYVEPDVQHKQISLHIRRNPAATITVEADLPNIYQKNVVVKKTDASVNKLIIYNEDDYIQSLTYYLHSDGSYDQSDTDRITPVLFKVTSVSVEEGTTFARAAMSAASEEFGSTEFNNIIELTMANEDTLVGPDTLEYGQVVNVISDGVRYKSILTGKEIGETTKLIFGTIRLDLTKLVRRK